MSTFGHDFAGLLEWLREEELFRDRPGLVASALWHDRRHGEPWINSGPEHLSDSASDRRRAERDVYKRVRGVAVLPRSQRPIIWALAIDRSARIVVGSTAALPPSAFGRVKDVCRIRLYPEGSPVYADEKFLSRALASTLNPGLPPMLAVDRWMSPTPPVLGMPVSFNATIAAASHTWQAGPPQPGWPVLGRLVGLAPMMVSLSPL